MLVLLSIRKPIHRSRKTHRCLAQGPEQCRCEKTHARIWNMVPDTEEVLSK